MNVLSHLLVHGRCSTRKIGTDLTRKSLINLFRKSSSSASEIRTANGYKLNFQGTETILKESVSFQNLKISSDLLSALEKNELKTATTIQSESFSSILEGKDVIIGGETGSGKTFAYILPLIEKCLESQGHLENRRFPAVMIIAPNKELCKQIIDMTAPIFNELKANGNEIKIDFISELTNHFPYARLSSPYFAVTTPAIYANYMKSKQCDSKALIRELKTIVLDEADMLLDGGFVNSIEPIYEVAKVVRRNMISEGLIKVSDRTLQSVLSAATIPNTGKRSVQEFVKKQFPHARVIRTDNMHQHHPCIEQVFWQAEDDLRPTSQSRVAAVIEAIKKVVKDDCLREIGNTVFADKMLNKIDTTTLSVPAGKQAAVVNLGGAFSAAVDVGADATEGADNLQKLSEDYEHQLESQARKQVVNYKPNEIKKTENNLLESVLNHYNHSVMIFLNKASTAGNFANLLRTNGIYCVEFHSNVPKNEKDENLKLFQSGMSRIIICTDAAARGLDLPNVKHVIQAEFALNIVQHQHRVGRASRNGKLGYATNFYDSNSRELLEKLLLNRISSNTPEVKKFRKEKKLRYDIVDSAASETVDETVAETTFETTPETVSETTSETVSETVTNTAVEAETDAVGSSDVDSSAPTTASAVDVDVTDTTSMETKEKKVFEAPEFLIARKMLKEKRDLDHAFSRRRGFRNTIKKNLRIQRIVDQAKHNVIEKKASDANGEVSLEEYMAEGRRIRAEMKAQKIALRRSMERE